jgi:hypothetical protein
MQCTNQRAHVVADEASIVFSPARPMAAGRRAGPFAGVNALVIMSSISEELPMDLLQFRRELQRADPDLQRLLELLDSLQSGSHEVVVRTSLTCDTLNPWVKDAELERDSLGMHEGK